MEVKREKVETEVERSQVKFESISFMSRHVEDLVKARLFLSLRVTLPDTVRDLELNRQ
jgi:hypothetical protein